MKLHQSQQCPCWLTGWCCLLLTGNCEIFPPKGIFLGSVCSLPFLPLFFLLKCLLIAPIIVFLSKERPIFNAPARNAIFRIGIAIDMEGGKAIFARVDAIRRLIPSTLFELFAYVPAREVKSKQMRISKMTYRSAQFLAYLPTSSFDMLCSFKKHLIPLP